MGSVDDGHHHAPAPTAVTTTATTADGSARRLKIALAINVVIVVAQIVVGIVARSLGLLSDAAHNLTDVVGLALAFVAVQFTRRPATAERSYGWHRGTILAAQANAAMILALTVWIAFEGVRRIIDPPQVDGPLVIVAAAIAFVANSVAALVVRGGHAGHAHPGHGGHAHGRDLNLRAATLHLISDAAASAGVVVAGVAITVLDGWYWLDPAVSLVIGASIAVHAWQLLRSSNAILLEGVPEGLDPVELHSTMLGVPGVEAVHDLHVWSIASNFIALSAHVVVAEGATLHDAQRVATEVRARLSESYGIEHSTLELEEDPCALGDHHCDPRTGADHAPRPHPHERH